MPCGQIVDDDGLKVISLYNKKPAPSMQVQVYNRLLQEMCSAEGLPFFDTVPITQNATSFDGLHYGMDVNVLKV